MPRELFPTIEHAVDRLIHGEAAFDLPATIDLLVQMINDNTNEAVRQAIIMQLEDVYEEHTEEL